VLERVGRRVSESHSEIPTVHTPVPWPLSGGSSMTSVQGDMDKDWPSGLSPQWGGGWGNRSARTVTKQGRYAWTTVSTFHASATGEGRYRATWEPCSILGLHRMSLVVYTHRYTQRQAPHTRIQVYTGIYSHRHQMWAHTDMDTRLAVKRSSLDTGRRMGKKLNF
jgi:hypothetical protein